MELVKKIQDFLKIEKKALECSDFCDFEIFQNISLKYLQFSFRTQVFNF